MTSPTVPLPLSSPLDSLPRFSTVTSRDVREDADEDPDDGVGVVMTLDNGALTAVLVDSGGVATEDEGPEEGVIKREGTGVLGSDG